MATKGYNLEQTGEQVQAALNKAINLGPATEETDGLMTAADKASLENLNTEINDKVDKVTGKGLSTNDFTNEDKDKLDTAYQVPSTGIPAADLSSGVQTSLGKANSAVQPADLVPITEKIPAQASAQNQLADKAFVNSSISTASADFKGTYDSLSELQAVTADKNDYGYVVSTDEAGNTVYSRYKYNGSAWVFEYDLNNSSFTAAEWAAIQSGITAPLVQKLGALPTNADLQSALSGKQATLVSGTNIKTVDGQSILGSGNLSVSDPNAVKVTAQTWTDAQKTQARTNIGAYAKPSGGIPKTDLASGVQGSLDLADSAIQARPSGEVDPTITPAEYATQEELAQLEAKVTELDEARYEAENIDISSRQQFILGYATKQGVFTDIGTGSAGLRYIPVESGKTYRMTGKYTGNATGKANLMFSANIPANDGVAVVITSERGVNEDFDVTYTPESDGYICLYVASVDYCGNFFAYSKELITDSLKEKDEELESVILEKSVGGISFSFLTGNVNNRGVCKNIGASVNYGFNYIPVTKGRKYTISGTYSNNAGTYAGMVFSETMLATNAVAVIVEMGTSGGTINKTYIPKLDGYLFAFSSNATFTEEKEEGKYLPKDSVFSYCKQSPIKLVGVADSKKYVTTADNKIKEGTADRTFMIQVSSGEKYLVRGRTHAYSQYAVIAFAQSNAVGTVAQVILSVNSEQLDYDFNQVVSIPANGYLIVWSSVRVYGSSNYAEILPLLDHITIDNDYYLPESLKLQTFGDSITDSSWGDLSSWVNYAPDNIQIQGLIIVNSGIGGSTYTGLRNLMENGGENSGGGVAPALQADADLVTIFLGTNDWSSGLTLDAVKTNIRNALDYLFETCKAKVLVMTPLQRYTSADAERDTNADGIPLNSAGYTLRELCDMIVDVCGMYSVPVLDLNATALINKFNIMDYSNDGLHPNQYGDIQVSRLICKKIKEMLRG